MTAGAACIVLAATRLVLLLSLGGKQFGWMSVTSLLLAIACGGVNCVLREGGAAFGAADHPPGVAARAGGFARRRGQLLLQLSLLGAIVCLSIYLQLVKGESATKAGLLIIGLMAGLLITSIASGQLVSHTGGTASFPLRARRSPPSAWDCWPPWACELACRPSPVT